MCRCVDFGSTNTSFRRVRVIGGVSPVDCETASASWLTLHRGGSGVNSPGEGLSPICGVPMASVAPRSEEHTSELQSLRHLVCRLLLEKKKKRNHVDSSKR